MRQIIAIGGGGFGRNSDANHIEQYILDQSKKSRPNILFIPTASAEPPEYIDNFYKVFEKLNCVPRHLSLFKRTPDLDKLFNQQDIFYVGGGNTKSMLAVWKEWNIDKFLKREYKNEKVMSGVSAGAICWFNKGVTDSWEKNLRLLNCLNFINDACCPHYDEEPEREPSTLNFISNKEIESIYCIEGGSALHFKNEVAYKNIQFIKNKNSYYLKNLDNKLVKNIIDNHSIIET